MEEEYPNFGYHPKMEEYPTLMSDITELDEIQKSARTFLYNQFI